MRILAVALSGFLLTTAMAAAAEPPADPSGLELVQSELKFLENPDLPIVAHLVALRPAEAFETIGEAAGMDVEIVGVFPENAQVTLWSDKITLKECLERVAEQIGAVYQVKSAKHLVVIVPQQAPGETPKDGAR